MLDLGDQVLCQVKKEVVLCDEYRRDQDPGCKRCIVACPAAKDAHVARNIQELNDASVGRVEPQDAVREFGLACMQTAKCVAPCPVGLRRDLMMLALKHHIKPLPADYLRYNLIRGTRLSLKGRLGQKVYDLKQRSRLGRLNRWNEKRPREHHDTLFFFGCYLNSPDICNDILELAEALGESYTVLGGMSTCCGWPQYLQGQFDLASEHLDNLRRDVARVAPRQVITACMECMAALERVKQDHNMDFRAVSAARWMVENLERLDLEPLSDQVIFHDSCHRCIKAGDCETAPDLLAKVVEGGVARFKPSGVGSLCCGHYNFHHTREHNAKLHQTKFRQAARAGAGVLVTECYTCAESFARDAPDELEVTDIVRYVARALRRK